MAVGLLDADFSVGKDGQVDGRLVREDVFAVSYNCPVQERQLVTVRMMQMNV